MRILLLSLICLTFACNKESSLTGNPLEEEIYQPALTLLHPKAEYSGRIDSIRFEWSYSEAAPQQLVIASDPQFNDILVDTVLMDNHFTATNFSPAQDYYWKIVTKEFDTRVLFSTADPLEDLPSQTQAETLKISWTLTTNRYDSTMIPEVIRLTNEDGGLRIQHGEESIDRLCQFENYFEDQYLYQFALSGSNVSYVYIDPNKRIIELNSRIGGIGSGSIYKTIFTY